MAVDYETLSKINPRLIYCENTAFGREGPLAKLGGYDIIVQALTGLMAGEAKMEGDVPSYIYPAIADYSTGIQMSNAICAALYAREKTGRGQRLDCTLLGTALAIQTTQFTWIDAWDDATLHPMLAEVQDAREKQLSFGEQLVIRGKYRPAAAGNIYYRVYQSSDGFVVIGALSDVLRRAVLKVTGLEDPRQRPDGTFDILMEGWDALGPPLVAKAEALFRTRTTNEWVEILSAENVPVGPVYFVEELFEHEQTKANNLVVEMEHPLLGHYRMIGPAFQMSETRLEVHEASPVLGADNDDTLRRAGLDDEKIAELRQQGIIR
jgi:formyl-CoA transferase